MARLLSDRLFALLSREVERLETTDEDRSPEAGKAIDTAGDGKPAARADGAGVDAAGGTDVAAGSAAARGAPGRGRAAGKAADRGTRRRTATGSKAPTARGGFKERADALILLARTLEKLLELRSLESAAGQDDEAETLRLRDDFMRRLRELDARRIGGPRLFAPSSGLDGAPRDADTAAHVQEDANEPCRSAAGRSADGGG
ncbi:hypothetical protein E3C22_16460 [Jiella endophytica]|uniref:Uncharacterized protein n=1 Tax=Jiella endophytica TaxID=2558362 RepID=A0A4Y8RE61_9HYPH|nr:hypothetical protein [Jiella endophytica]TFF20501.1 hypothetical protein E3C22_16460 [Jiella endophytica]